MHKLNGIFGLPPSLSLNLTSAKISEKRGMWCQREGRQFAINQSGAGAKTSQ